MLLSRSFFLASWSEAMRNKENHWHLRAIWSRSRRARLCICFKGVRTCYSILTPSKADCSLSARLDGKGLPCLAAAAMDVMPFDDDIHNLGSSGRFLKN